MLCLTTGLTGSGVAATERQYAESPLDAIVGGHGSLTLRPRYEHVDQAGKGLEADAFTMRSLLAWETLPWSGLSARAEVINVGHAFGQHYNDGFNGNTRYPLVGDVDETDFNQLYAEYSALPDTRLRAGKQIVRLANARFIGNRDFRQNMQLLTGVMGVNRSLPDTELSFGHLWRVKSPATIRQKIGLQIAHADWTWKPGNHLIGYGYFYDETGTQIPDGFADNSSRIIGLRADGAYPLGVDWKALYTAEQAQQRPHGSGDVRIDASYQHFAVGAQWRDAFVRVDYERLGSNAGQYGFQTPLANRHAFQGLADLFLITPAEGVRDWYLGAGTTVGAARLYGEYHWFRSDFGDIRYGQELNLGVLYTVPWVRRLSARIEYAEFHEEDVLVGAARKPDTRKLWLTLLYTFE